MAALDNTPVLTFSTNDFSLDCGTTLPTLNLAYKTYGIQGNPSILISTCFGERISRINLLIGDGKAADTTKYFVIRIALLGNGDSSSPSNTPAPYDGENFPLVSYSDMVRAHVLLLESLNIRKLEAVIGFSMGGQVAYHWAALYPQIVERIVATCSSSKTSIHNKAFLEGPKAALIASGDYSVNGKGTKAFGRAYCAWVFSYEWFEQRKFEDEGFTSLEDFIERAWTNPGQNGYDLLSMARTWQASDISKCRLQSTSTDPHPDIQSALSAIAVKVLLMPCRSDQYFTPEASVKEVKLLQNCTLKVIESIHGHRSGGGSNHVDQVFVDKEVAAFLKL